MAEKVWTSFIVLITIGSAAWALPSSFNQQKPSLHERHNDEIYAEGRSSPSGSEPPPSENGYEYSEPPSKALKDYSPRNDLLWSQNSDLPPYPFVTRISEQREASLFSKIDQVIAFLKTILVQEIRRNKQQTLQNVLEHKDDAQDQFSDHRGSLAPNSHPVNVDKFSPNSQNIGMNNRGHGEELTVVHSELPVAKESNLEKKIRPVNSDEHPLMTEKIELNNQVQGGQKNESVLHSEMNTEEVESSKSDANGGILDGKSTKDLKRAENNVDLIQPLDKIQDNTVA